MGTKTLLNDTPTNLLKKYREVIVKAGIPVEQMILFGSHAEGNATAWSDVDVCVVSPLFGKKPFMEMLRLAKLARTVDTMIEPHPYNSKDLADKYDPLAHEIRTHGVPLT